MVSSDALSVIIINMTAQLQNRYSQCTQWSKWSFNLNPMIQIFSVSLDEAKTYRMLLHYYHTANSHWKGSAHCYEIEYTICIFQHSKCKINIPTISPLPSCGWKNWLLLTSVRSIYCSNFTFLFYSLWKKDILGIFRK